MRIVSLPGANWHRDLCILLVMAILATLVLLTFPVGVSAADAGSSDPIVVQLDDGAGQRTSLASRGNIFCRPKNCQFTPNVSWNS
jgi:hypothetical protein